MIRDGWRGPISNIDFSPVVVEQMKKKYCKEEFTRRYQCPEMTFVCGDITKRLPFEDQSFDLIVCKATFDSILCGEGSVSSAKNVIAECSRILANGHGVLFLLSYGNPDSRVVFLEHDNDLSYYWKEVSIHNVGRMVEGRYVQINEICESSFIMTLIHRDLNSSSFHAIPPLQQPTLLVHLPKA